MVRGRIAVLKQASDLVFMVCVSLFRGQDFCDIDLGIPFDDFNCSLVCNDLILQISDVGAI